MSLTPNTKNLLKNLRASKTDLSSHEGFGQMIEKAWQWRGRDQKIVHKNPDTQVRGHVRQDESISAEAADERTLQRIQSW